MATPPRVIQLTPHPWEDSEDPLNAHIRRLAAALAAKGARVLVAGPSRDPARLDRDRRALAEGRLNFGQRFVALVEAPLEGGPLGPLPAGAGGELCERLLSQLRPDLLHLHDPYPTTLGAAALRRSAVITVATFHAAASHHRPTLPGRAGEGLFARLDGVITPLRCLGASYGHGLAAPLATIDPATPLWPLPAQPGLREQLLYPGGEGRTAARLVLRAWRRLELDGGWRLVAIGEQPIPRRPLPAPLIRLAGGQKRAEREATRSAIVVVCGPSGVVAALAALRAGATVVAPSLPIYRELLDGGRRGLLYLPADPADLALQLQRAHDNPALRAELGLRAAQFGSTLGWERSAEAHLDFYGRLLARRRRPPGPAPQAERFDVDLHMHTNHSYDCATPVEALLESARAAGLGAVAVTDHNEISGALAARDLADRYGVEVIVGEEVKTAGEGEVIGLFLERRIPPGLTLSQTIAEIKAQGGVVYVPHPFDRLHSVPDYRYLLPVLEQVDALEVYNARVAIAAYNAEAVRFAAKYRLPAGAGSDAHVPQGLGSVRVRMARFDGPQQFLRSLAEAEIIARPKSLLYVQALKFLQTRTPLRELAR